MPRTERNTVSAIAHAALEPRVEHVADAAIRKKWKKLTTSNHDPARSIIRSAQQQSRMRQTRRADDQKIEDCVQEVSGRLSDRLPRIPYPPGTEESHFDNEANLRRVAKLESQLTANIHSTKLLQAQIEKEEALLRHEEDELSHLRSNSAAVTNARKMRVQNLHPLVKNLGQHTDNMDLLDLDQGSRKDSRPAISSLCEDEELGPLLLQLENHLSSIDQNILPLQSVGQNVRRAKHALDAYALLGP